ncbi:hypothetical protein [Listeria costaricensis]|uniref:hypothetical protein n=1 Tax=Listeria costaricensis TaxID=2026604 RepID=UPI000C08D13C|nr:hypothetical protein [Listeria costaricensis]
MKRQKPSNLLLLFVGFFFLMLALINMGISYFWDFSDSENQVVGILLLIFSISIFTARHFFVKKGSK